MVNKGLNLFLQDAICGFCYVSSRVLFYFGKIYHIEETTSMKSHFAGCNVLVQTQ